MRGLTKDEHALLVFLAQAPSVDAPMIEASFGDTTCTVCEQLLAAGRVLIYEAEEDGWIWDRFEITDRGELALKLWPATMATVPGQ